MKKIALLIMLFLLFVPAAGAQYSLTLNTDEIRIGDNDPDSKISWVKDFDVPEANPANAELSVACRDVENGDQPIRINGILIGRLDPTERDVFSTFSYALPSGTLLPGNNTITIATTFTPSFQNYDDISLGTIELTYRADNDGDDVADDLDNCPTVPNADQADADDDGSGDLVITALMLPIRVRRIPMGMGSVTSVITALIQPTRIKKISMMTGPVTSVITVLMLPIRTRWTPMGMVAAIGVIGALCCASWEKIHRKCNCCGISVMTYWRKPPKAGRS